MASRWDRHMRVPAPAPRQAPPCMWRGAGMELSEDLYALQPAWGWRGRVKGGASCLNVLHLSVDTTRGRIRHSLNTSDDAKPSNAPGQLSRKRSMTGAFRRIVLRH